MDLQDKKVLEELESDFHKIASKNGWTPEDYESMKNIQKLMYYMEVRCAMKEGQEARDARYTDGAKREWGQSYDRGTMPRGGSGRYSYDRGSYRYMPERRYYDGGRESSISEIRRAMAMEQDPEVREAMENVVMMMEDR